MLTLLHGPADSVRTIASLRAACEALQAGEANVSAVSVSGRLPAARGSALPLLSSAERLAAEFGCGVIVRLERGGFDVRFSRVSPNADVPAADAG